MSEKRFSIHELVHYDEEQDKWVDCDRYCITDNERHINYDLKFDEKQLCSLLNEQQATISALKEENEQLRKELDSFKPVMFQDMRKGTVRLYSKGGIDE